MNLYDYTKRSFRLFLTFFFRGNPKICHVPREFIFISPYTPEADRECPRTKAKRALSKRKIRIARKIIIFLYHNLMFPPRFESSFNIHPRFLHSLDFHLFLRSASRTPREDRKKNFARCLKKEIRKVFLLSFLFLQGFI